MATFEEWVANGSDLDDVMGWALDEYTEDFQAYWGLNGDAAPENLDPDRWHEYVRIARLVEKLASGASALTRPRKVRESDLAMGGLIEREARQQEAMIGDILEKLKAVVPDEEFHELFSRLKASNPDDPRTKHHFFQTCLQVEAWKTFPCSPGAMGERLGQLFDFLVRAPGPFTRAYLSRVAECYVRDLPTEFAVMARAALDAAISERLTDEAVLVEVGGGRGSGWVTLERRIEACAARGWFDASLRRAATRIRECGRDAAHFTPGLEVAPHDLLDDLASVLRALEAVEPSK